MQMLKFMVILGALVIFAGFGFIGDEVYHRISPNAQARDASGAIVSPSGITNLDVNLPPGAVLVGMTTVSDRVVLQANLPNSGFRLVVIDPRRPAVTATINLSNTLRRPAAEGEAEGGSE